MDPTDLVLQPVSNYRPLFHLTPPSGWMNDPNGPVWHGGLWHLFYQHNPHSPACENMHWGHAVSRDLSHWEHWPVALYPDELGFIFSGSAAVTGDGLVACFTHCGDNLQTQGLAFSHDDGRSWEKFAGNPILDIGKKDFRDPKIFRHGDEWRMVVSAGAEAQIYSSPDLVEWTLLSTLPGPAEGWIWECPDLFPLAGKWVLIASFVIPGSSSKDGNTTRYWIGDFDGTAFTAESGPLPISFGPDDYAGVTWSDAPEGRRILVAWMSHWHYAMNSPTESDGWRGTMTLPREITLEDGVLIQRPPQELNARRGQPITFSEKGIACPYPAFELEVTIDLSGQTETPAGLRLRNASGEWVQIAYDPARRELSIDRTESGRTDFHPDFAAAYRGPLAVLDGIVRSRIFVDRCSVEVFAQDGLLYGAALVFPSSPWSEIAPFGAGSKIAGTLYPIDG